MALTDVATGRETKSIVDEDAWPTEQEVQAARTEILEAARAAADRLNEGDKRRGDLATVGDLSDLADLMEWRAMSFTIAHVKRRAVLKEDAAVETTVKTLQPIWRGIWREGAAHSKGALVVCDSALWVSTKATIVRPGTPGGEWRLVVKSPR